MVDWTKPMGRTYEYFVVDPGTWKDARRLSCVTGCTIRRDRTSDTLGSASIDVAGEALDECYVRVYLVALQNGRSERFPLGTYLVQAPSTKFDGRVQTVTLDAYTPLIELKESSPPLGFSLLKGSNVVERCRSLLSEHMRAPVLPASSEKELYGDFVANTSDTWMTFLSDLAANAEMSIDLDETGRALLSPDQDAAALQPVWTYSDSNSSILYSDLTVDRDLYGIPNVVEVTYSDGTDFFQVRAVNDDSASPTSTVARGREILYRETSPRLSGVPTEGQLRLYAEKTLSQLSTVEYTLTYSHGYCPVRVGDCVRLDYKRAGIEGVKARVSSQSIKCDGACQVSEKATYTKKYWG